MVVYENRGFVSITTLIQGRVITIDPGKTFSIIEPSSLSLSSIESSTLTKSFQGARSAKEDFDNLQALVSTGVIVKHSFSVNVGFLNNGYTIFDVTMKQADIDPKKFVVEIAGVRFTGFKSPTIDLNFTPRVFNSQGFQIPDSEYTIDFNFGEINFNTTPAESILPIRVMWCKNLSLAVVAGTGDEICDKFDYDFDSGTNGDPGFNKDTGISWGVSETIVINQFIFEVSEILPRGSTPFGTASFDIFFDVIKPFPGIIFSYPGIFSTLNPEGTALLDSRLKQNGKLLTNFSSFFQPLTVAANTKIRMNITASGSTGLSGIVRIYNCRFESTPPVTG